MIHLIKTGDKNIKKVNIYTDGACSGNPGPGGWGAILECGGREKELSGGAAETTNNRMELTAAITALEALKEPCEVTLTTDSKYVSDAVEKGWIENWKAKGWKRKDGELLNPELWQKLDELLQIHKVSLIWVKGHDGHEKNERCDMLAVKAIENFKK